MKQQSVGHLIALVTVAVWGTTFISTKILLESFSPVEILFIRFLLGFVCLSIVCPHPLRLKHKKQEIYFMLAGICGVTLYFLFENIALTLTMASNVGVIVAISPFSPLCSAVSSIRDNRCSPVFFLAFYWPSAALPASALTDRPCSLILPEICLPQLPLLSGHFIPF